MKTAMATAQAATLSRSLIVLNILRAQRGVLRCNNGLGTGSVSSWRGASPSRRAEGWGQLSRRRRVRKTNGFVSLTDRHASSRKPRSVDPAFPAEP